jgi:hypothetical protein
MAADGSFSVRIHGRCRRSGAAGSRCGYLDDFFKLAVCGIPRRCQVLLTDRPECPRARVRARALLEISSSGMIFCISQVGVGDWFFPQVDG